MKQLFAAICLTVFAGIASAQIYTDNQLTARMAEIEQNKKMAQLTQKVIDKKVLNDAKKQAKRLKKEGWKESPGSLPMEKQLTNMLLKRYERVNDFPVYIVTESSYKADDQRAARRGAKATADAEIGEQIAAEVATSTGLEYNGAADHKDVLLDKIRRISKASIRNTETVLEIYREVNGMYEYHIGVAYSGSSAKNIIEKAQNE